jgi:ketosteroid isomerase-like protein
MRQVRRRGGGIVAWLAVCVLLSGSLLVMLPTQVHAREPAEIRLLEKYFVAMRAKDRAAVEALLPPDAVFRYAYDRGGSTEPGAERQFVGSDAVMRDIVDRAFRLMSKLGWHEPAYTISADRRTVFVEVRGDMVLGASTPYRNQYVIRVDLRDGLIAGMSEYMNTVTASQAIDRDRALFPNQGSVPISSCQQGESR